MKWIVDHIVPIIVTIVAIAGIAAIITVLVEPNGAVADACQTMLDRVMDI